MVETFIDKRLRVAVYIEDKYDELARLADKMADGWREIDHELAILHHIKSKTCSALSVGKSNFTSTARDALNQIQKVEKLLTQ